MARRLRGAGIDVRAWNRTRAKAEALAADGVSVAGSPRAAVSGGPVVALVVMASRRSHQARRLRQGHPRLRGGPLARAELRIALPELLRRLPGLRLAEGRPPERHRICFARGFTQVWVEWDAA